MMARTSSFFRVGDVADKTYVGCCDFPSKSRDALCNTIWNHKPQIGGVLNGGSPMNVKVDDSVLLATMMPCWEAPSGPVQPIFHRKSLHWSTLGWWTWYEGYGAGLHSDQWLVHTASSWFILVDIHWALVAAAPSATQASSDSKTFRRLREGRRTNLESPRCGKVRPNFRA